MKILILWSNSQFNKTEINKFNSLFFKIHVFISFNIQSHLMVSNRDESHRKKTPFTIFDHTHKLNTIIIINI